MLKKYFELEEKFDVSKAKIGNLQLWPYLRIYFGYQLVYENMIVGAATDRKNLLSILRTFFVGTLNLMRRYDYLFFSVSEQRRNIHGVLYDRFDYIVKQLNGKSLFFELLFPIHHSVETTPTRYVTSRSPLFFLEFILIKLLFFKKIEGKEILNRINESYKLRINYHFLSRKFLAQYLIGRFLSLFYKPKAVFMITAYTNLGYLVAFRRAGIKVIEMQHGIINHQHAGYNPTIDFGDCYKPSSLLTYGHRELTVFQKNQCYISYKNVFPVGHFYFEYLLTEYRGDERLNLAIKHFSKIVAISAEYDFEKEIIPFVNRVAKKAKDCLFLYMPRNKKAHDYIGYDFEKNVIITDWLNSYQVMRHADFHTCVRSTTALEAIPLGTQNILYNIRGYASAYYRDILTDQEITQFVDSEEEYIVQLYTFRRLSREDVTNSSNNFIVPGFKDNLRNILNKILT